MSGAIPGRGDPVAELRRRAPSVALGYPIFAYSYSSRALVDVAGFFAATIAENPRPLVSLYDAHHHLGEAVVVGARTSAAPWFFDSGNYEIHGSGDPWVLAGPPGRAAWTPDLYVETARHIVRPGDVLVSFDQPQASLEEQVEFGCALMEEASRSIQGVRRDLLLHPNGAPPADVAQLAMAAMGQIHILGLTEKGMGLPWQVTAGYIRELREILDAGTGDQRYVPLHVFGCLDPRTVRRLFLAGADIFDGLAWSRYLFRGDHTYYSREFEDVAPVDEFVDERAALRALAAHNVREMERLADDLRYAVGALDPAGLEDAVLALEGTTGAEEEHHT